MWKIVSAALLLAFCSSVQAGRPLATEDAGMIDAGGVELESYFLRFTVPK